MKKLLNNIEIMIKNKEDKNEIERLIGVACQLYDKEESEETKEKLKQIIQLYKSSKF